MRIICLISMIWGVVCWNSAAQTNDAAVVRPAFSVSATVRPVAAKPPSLSSSREAGPDKSATEAASPPGIVHLAEVMTASTAGGEPAARLYRRLEQSGNLNLLEPVRPSGSGGVINAIFEPEIIRMGKTTVSSSIITAYKRKNPLCLLNPIFFNLSW